MGKSQSVKKAFHIWGPSLIYFLTLLLSLYVEKMAFCIPIQIDLKCGE